MTKHYFILLLGFVLILSGCGGEQKITVTGNISFEDGTPLTIGNVVMQSGNRAMQGGITTDGTFSMGMVKSGEGIPPGVYQVGVEASNGPGKSLIDPKLANPSTSGLTFEVKAGQKNHLELTVSPLTKSAK